MALPMARQAYPLSSVNGEIFRPITDPLLSANGEVFRPITGPLSSANGEVFRPNTTQEFVSAYKPVTQQYLPAIE